MNREGGENRKGNRKKNGKEQKAEQDREEKKQTKKKKTGVSLEAACNSIYRNRKEEQKTTD